LPPLPFNEQNYQALANKSGRRKLRIGYYDTLPLFESSQSVKRAIKIAKEKLEAEGCTLVPFKISYEENFALKKYHSQACVIGVFGQFIEALNTHKEDPVRVYNQMFFFFSLPRFLQAIIKFLVKLTGNHRLAMIMDWLHEYNREEIDEALRGRERIDREMNTRWIEEKLDAVISPAYYHCAIKHEDGQGLAMNADYTAIWNTLHFPAGVVPVTEVLPGEENGYNDQYNDLMTSRCRSNVQGSAGMPILVQVSTMKWKDEECIAIMKILDQAVNFRKFPKDLDVKQPYVEKTSSFLWFIKYFLMLIMAALYIFAGFMHFKNPHHFEEMMPGILPFHKELNVIAGLFEILGGLGLLLPQTRKISAWGLIALLFAVLPANFHIAIYDVPVFGATT